MAHVFKIVQKRFQISTDGSSYTLLNDLEFISQPYATPQERSTAASLKWNELMQQSNLSLYVSYVQGEYMGTVTNNNYLFPNETRAWSAGLCYEGNKPNTEQIKARFKEIQQQERYPQLTT